jgi:cytochrome P450
MAAAKIRQWSFLGLSHARLRERFSDRLYTYAEDASPHSLIGTLAQLSAQGSIDAVGQVPHWLFAFDAAGMAALRAIAVLATHPEDRYRCETGDLDQPQLRPFLRSCVLESVRLWPTTPAIPRELTADTTFGEGTRFNSGSSVLIATPAFHRDPALLPFANDFVPDVWANGRAEEYPQLVPFSAEPAECPGRNLVLFVTSTDIAHLLSMVHLELQSTPVLDRPAPCRSRSTSLVWPFGPPRRRRQRSTDDLDPMQQTDLAAPDGFCGSRQRQWVTEGVGGYLPSVEASPSCAGPVPAGVVALNNRPRTRALSSAREQ